MTTNTGGSIIPAKEFDGKLWILAGAYQQAMQAAYMGGVLAEREACAKVLEKISTAPDMQAYAAAIRARGEK